MISPMVHSANAIIPDFQSHLDYAYAYPQPYSQEFLSGQSESSSSCHGNDGQATFLRLRPPHILSNSNSSYNTEHHHHHHARGIQIQPCLRDSPSEGSPSPKLSPSSSSSPSPSSSSLASSSGQHAWVQTSQVTTSKALNHMVCEYSNNGIKTFFCGWAGCKHPVGFTQKPQLITHIRSAHLQEKPFMCTTCKVQFSRKQEASRHVLSMNSGRKYKCSACHQSFSRKNYRDAHEETCMFDDQSSQHVQLPPTPVNTPPLSTPPLSYSPQTYFC